MAALTLRIDDDLHEELKKTAEHHHRSLTGEIRLALELYVQECNRNRRFVETKAWRKK